MLTMHYNNTVLPTRPQDLRDNPKVEIAVHVFEPWILVRRRHPRIFSPRQRKVPIPVLLDELNNQLMRHLGQNRSQMFKAMERDPPAPLPSASSSSTRSPAKARLMT